MSGIHKALQEEGIPDYWLHEPELWANGLRIEEELAQQRARLDDEIARNSAAVPDLFGGTTTEFTWQPKTLRRDVLRAPRAHTLNEVQQAIELLPGKKRYAKEAERNFLDFTGTERECRMAMLEASADDVVAARGEKAVLDVWLWIWIPDPVQKPFTFANCCAARAHDPDDVRRDMETLIHYKLGGEAYQRLRPTVLRLALEEGHRIAHSVEQWRDIATLRDELTLTT